MVEKISETALKAIADVEPLSDERRLLERITKKKKEKKNAESEDLAAVIQQHIPYLLTKSPLHEGGMLITDRKKTPSGDSRHQMSPALVDRQQHKSILAIAGYRGTPLSDQTLSETAETTLQRRRGEVDVKKIADGNAISERKKGLSPVKEAAVQTRQEERISAVHHHFVAMASRASTDSLPRRVEPESQNKRKEETDVIKPYSPPGTTQDFSVSERSEASSRDDKTQPLRVMLQAHATGSAARMSTEKASMDLNYQFQRWSGEHSVKVSIPIDVRGEKNITLLPSDSRSAEVLSRQMAHFSGYNPELLQPQRDRDQREHQNQRQRDAREEEQE